MLFGWQNHRYCVLSLTVALQTAMCVLIGFWSHCCSFLTLFSFHVVHIRVYTHVAKWKYFTSSVYRIQRMGHKKMKGTRHTTHTRCLATTTTLVMYSHGKCHRLSCFWQWVPIIRYTCGFFGANCVWQVCVSNSRGEPSVTTIQRTIPIHLLNFKENSSHILYKIFSGEAYTSPYCY